MLPETIRPIHSLELFKLLGDPTRLAILQHLMDNQASLSQLALHLDSYPSKIRHHLMQLERGGLIRLAETRQLRGFVEKFYKATARAYHINLVILPEVQQAKTLLAFTSHDLALELLAEFLRSRNAPIDFIPVAVGSLDSLIALRQRVCHLAGCHLLDLDTGTYNIPYIQRIFPGQTMRVIHLARRLQGLIIQPGNPLQIRGIEDLARTDVRLANRKRGTGTRLWLDHKLQALGLEPKAIQGYDQVLDTHLQVANAVAEGRADAGLGLFAAALQNEMGFIPVFEEAFDLVVPAEAAILELYQPVWNLLTSAEFRIGVQALGGYYPRHMGDVITI